ncbi:MAG: zinc-ribbon domain-containing protein, partial [Gemmatimonadota bacterium]
MQCPQCHAAVESGARFCSACGAAVAAPGDFDAEDQTRLLTVLFADLSGSVAATHGLDPEDAVNRVNQALDLMARSVTTHGGRVDRYLGDGLLALFGAPRAHEDDSLRAISAATQRERYVASSETVENARRAWETIEPSGVLHEAGHARFVHG